jgi:hypothetical protein
MKKSLFFCLIMLFSFGFPTHTLFAQNKRPISSDVINKLDSLSPEQWKQLQKKKAKFATYNTYKVLINAGFHAHAERLREFYKKGSKIDLATEPLQSKFE